MSDVHAKPIDQCSDPTEDIRTLPGSGGTAPARDGKPSRHLIIKVTENGKPTTNVRIPLGLARVGLKFIPAKEKENLKQQGVDVEELLGELRGDEMGPLVQVDEEGKSVWIGVE